MVKKHNTLLITGGAGFMGSYFVRFWLRNNVSDKVIVLDKLTYAGNRANLREVKGNTRFCFVRGDIADKSLVGRLVKKIDYLINFAAETHVDRSIYSGESFVKTDVLGTYNLLEQVRLLNPRIKKYIQISTDEVFGSVTNGYFTARSPFAPNSPYSASKAGGDLLCQAFYKTYDLPIVVTHSCNFIGPYQYPEKMVPLFITNLLLNKKVPLYGRGKNTREWIYAEDYCRALSLVVRKASPGEKILIGSGERINNLEITKKILKLLDKDDSWIQRVTDRPGHDLRYALKASWLKSQGWRPKINLDEALRLTINWYRDNSWWWLPIRNKKMKAYYNRQYKRTT